MDIKINNYYSISYTGKNKDIRAAQKVLHRIKSDYSAASPYLIYLWSAKHGKQMSKFNPTNHHLYALREVQKKYIDSDLIYAEKLLKLVKRARSANCKEYSELAYIIAKLNGFEDCNCVNFAKLTPDGTYDDIEHTVLLVNQKVPKDKVRLHKFYDEDVTNASAFVPSKKSIVIDPLFGIVDYWDNAFISYQNLYPEITKENLYVAARKPVLPKRKDVRKLKQKYPELIIEKPKSNVIQILFNNFLNFITPNSQKISQPY